MHLKANLESSFSLILLLFFLLLLPLLVLLFLLGRRRRRRRGRRRGREVTGSRDEIRRFQAMGPTGFNLYREGPTILQDDPCCCHQRVVCVCGGGEERWLGDERERLVVLVVFGRVTPPPPPATTAPTHTAVQEAQLLCLVVVWGWGMEREGPSALFSPTKENIFSNVRAHVAFFCGRRRRCGRHSPGG